MALTLTQWQNIQAFLDRAALTLNEETFQGARQALLLVHQGLPLIEPEERALTGLARLAELSPEGDKFILANDIPSLPKAILHDNDLARLRWAERFAERPPFSLASQRIVLDGFVYTPADVDAWVEDYLNRSVSVNNYALMETGTEEPLTLLLKHLPELIAQGFFTRKHVFRIALASGNAYILPRIRSEHFFMEALPILIDAGLIDRGVLIQARLMEPAGGEARPKGMFEGKNNLFFLDRYHSLLAAHGLLNLDPFWDKIFSPSTSVYGWNPPGTFNYQKPSVSREQAEERLGTLKTMIASVEWQRQNPLAVRGLLLFAGELSDASRVLNLGKIKIMDSESDIIPSHVPEKMRLWIRNYFIGNTPFGPTWMFDTLSAFPFALVGESLILPSLPQRLPDLISRGLVTRDTVRGLLMTLGVPDFLQDYLCPVGDHPSWRVSSRRWQTLKNLFKMENGIHRKERKYYEDCLAVIQATGTTPEVEALASFLTVLDLLSTTTQIDEMKTLALDYLNPPPEKIGAFLLQVLKDFGLDKDHPLFITAERRLSDPSNPYHLADLRRGEINLSMDVIMNLIFAEQNEMEEFFLRTAEDLQLTDHPMVQTMIQRVQRVPDRFLLTEWTHEGMRTVWERYRHEMASHDPKTHRALQKKFLNFVEKNLKRTPGVSFLNHLVKSGYTLIERDFKKNLSQDGTPETLKAFEVLFESSVWKDFQKTPLYFLLAKASTFMRPAGLSSMRRLILGSKQGELTTVHRSFNREGNIAEETRSQKLRFIFDRYSELEGVFPASVLTPWQDDYRADLFPMLQGGLDEVTAQKALKRQVLRQVGLHNAVDPGLDIATVPEKIRGLPFQVAQWKKAYESGDEIKGDTFLKTFDLLRTFENHYQDIRDHFGNTFALIKRDLENFLAGMKKGMKQARKSLVFEVSGDLETIALSGSIPVETCQNLERLWVDAEGQPLHRMMHGQFKVANWIIDGEVMARRLIEITLDGKGRTHLLVEELYSAGGFGHVQEFREHIVSYAENILGLSSDHVHFSDEDISKAPPPLNNGDRIYRDTFLEPGPSLNEVRTRTASFAPTAPVPAQPQRRTGTTTRGHISLAPMGLSTFHCTDILDPEMPELGSEAGFGSAEVFAVQVVPKLNPGRIKRDGPPSSRPIPRPTAHRGFGLVFNPHLRTGISRVPLRVI